MTLSVFVMMVMVVLVSGLLCLSYDGDGGFGEWSSVSFL